MKNTIHVAIQNGVRFLAHKQESDGSFMCLTSTIFDDYSNATVVPAIVPANIVLSSLAHIEETETVHDIKKRVAGFLLTQRGAFWSFNYWYKNTKEYTEIPYPDDLDDTFCALAALYEYDAKLFDGEAMGKIVTMLTMAEDREGGPYNMCLIPKTNGADWKDIDLVVNSNIAYFLYLQDVEVPNLTAFIETSIEEDDYEFPYNTIYPGIYFISRFYKGAKSEHMINLILSKKESDGKWENPLRTALAISALLNLSNGTLWKELGDSIHYIQDTQSKDGSWGSYAFFYQMKREEKTLYAGSESITTAFCIEALNKFQQAEAAHESKNNEAHNSSLGPVLSVKQQYICKAIEERAKKRFAELTPELKTYSLFILSKMIEGDTQKEIILLADWFRQSLGILGNNIQDELIIELGLSNVYGWIAYTIYDDFLDNEGAPNMLSTANVCLRESFAILGHIFPNNFEFTQFYREIFDTIDGANAWETTHCRINSSNKEIHIPEYVDYAQLANRSLGHAINPVAILYKLRYRIDSEESKHVLEFFKHYLIARQLNDDAHDWQEDYARGQISAVVTEIIRDTNNTSTSIKEMEQVFWSKTILSVCQKIIEHITLAKESLSKVSIIEQPQHLLKLLTPIEQSVTHTIESREETQKFIFNFS